MDTRTVMELADRYLMRTYRRAPVAFRAGQGTRLVGVDGRTYLDFVAGIAVCVLGHNHPALTRAICEQAARLLHVSNLYHIPEQVDLARWLVDRSGADRVFFCNSGAEAVEAAIKIARKSGRSGGADRYQIVVAERAFHGRTLGALAATGTPRYRQPFEPLPPGFVAVPFNDIPALRAAVTPETCAVMLEPVQGEGGVHPASRDYLAEARRLCDAHGLLLILDEVQTGMGRTGRLFAYEHYGVMPDVVTLAKGLGGGVPIGAVLARGRAADTLEPGDHGSTFGGNPLACTAALAVARTLEDEDLVGRAARMGAYLMERLQMLARRHPAVTDVRGLGLLVGVELAGPAAPVVDACRRRGLLVNAVQPTVLRLAPPLIVGEPDIDEAIHILDAALADVAAGLKEEGP